MADRSVALRLATTGKAQVKQDLTEIGDAGDAQGKRWQKAYADAGDEIERQMQRQAQAAQKLAAIMPATSTQQIYQAGASTNYGGGSARDSALAMRELLAAEEQLTTRTNAFRASIDPAWVAQGRFNVQMAEARSLIAQGAITLDQYCDKLRMETAALKASSGAADSVVAGHGRMSTSGMILQHVMRSTVDSFSAGLPVTMILGEQLSRLGEAAAYAGGGEGEGGGKGKLAALAAFMSGPWGFAFTAAIGVAGALVPKLFEGADAAEVMKQHQEALAAVIDQTTGRINEQSKALLLNAAIMSQKDAKAATEAADSAKRSIGKYAQGEYSAGSQPGMSGGGTYTASNPLIVNAIAAFNRSGDADALARKLAQIGQTRPGLKETTDQIIALSAAYVEADRKAQQAGAQQRLLTGQAKPGDQRKAIGQFGPEKPDLSLVDAQAKLAASSTKSEKAEAQATITRIEAKKAYDEGSISIDQYKARMIAADKAVSDAKEHTDKHAQALARQAESMEVSARGAIDVANAYLKSSDAGLLAEARRKAATDATRKGISVDEQAERQLALAAAEQIAAAAKSVAALGDEASARDAVLAKVKDGTVAALDMDQALKVELALRPLLAARAHVHGDALDVLNKTIDATTAALERSNVAAGKFEIGKQIENSRLSAIELKAQLDDVGKTPLDIAINAAGRGAAATSDKAGLAFDDPERMDLYRRKVSEAKGSYNLSKGRYLQSTLDNQSDSLELSQRELELAGANDNYRTVELDKLKKMIDIRRQFPDMSQADIDKQLQGIVALDETNAKLKVTAATLAEMRSFGGQFVDDVLSPDTWSSWGNAGKTILKDIENEFIKLALLNPIKNMLNGNSDLPTLGTLSKLTGLFGGVSTISASSVNSMLTSTLGSIDASLPHNASGTDNWSGGRTWVNENGPEIADLPNGTRIYPAAVSRQMMQAANDGGGAGHTIIVNAQDAVLSETVRGWVADGIDIASTRGAAGGAAMGQAQTMAAGKRKLGRSW